jgi:hypothetical protein
MYTISVGLKEHGANGPKTRGRREERTHSQAARTRAAFETQKIRRDSFVLQPNFVEAAGRTDNSATDMTLCVSVSWGASSFKTEPSHSLRCDRSTAGTSSSLIITVVSITFESRCYSIQLTYSKVQVGQPTQHTFYTFTR